MTNPDTSTLNGALEQLGITMADNLVTMGVSDADPSDGLTTLAGKILDITPGPGPTPTPSSILLTADKSILSYADSESATLSATVLDSSDNPLEGVTVTFYNGSTSMGTADTNSSGIASKTYSSAGVGDVSFTAEVGSLSSETYIIEDCWYYNSQTYQSTGTSSQTLNKTIPSNCTISFESYVPSSTGCNSYIALGTDTNHRLGIGVVNGGAKYRLFVQDNASSGTNVDTSTSNTPSQWKEQTATVNGNTVTYYDLTRTLSSTNLTNFWAVNLYNGGVRNIKIKPL